jgi:hypothetical protein
VSEVNRNPASVNLAEPMFPNEGPQDILNLLLNAGVTRFRRRHDDVLSLDELMLHPIVGEMFELLECHKRPGAHVFMILSARSMREKHNGEYVSMLI